MTKEEFLEELAEAKNERADLVAEVKSYKLPVIIFGAGGYAVGITKMLNEYGLEIDGYAVDEEYYKPNQIYLNRPVYNFAELYRNPKNQVFLSAIRVDWETEERYNKTVGRRWKFINDENIIKYYFITPGQSGEKISYEFIKENKDKFWETYNMLSDDWSKKTMLRYLKSHISDMIQGIKEIFDSEEYFNEFTRPAVCGGGGGGGGFL